MQKTNPLECRSHDPAATSSAVVVPITVMIIKSRMHVTRCDKKGVPVKISTTYFSSGKNRMMRHGRIGYR